MEGGEGGSDDGREGESESGGREGGLRKGTSEEGTEAPEQGERGGREQAEGGS